MPTIDDIIIFQDLDGCLGDLAKHAEQWLPYKVTNLIHHDQLEEAIQNMLAEHLKIPEFIKIDDHKELIAKFWSTIPWTKTGKSLWKAINNLGCEIQILTALPLETETSKFPGTTEGKLDWCKKNLSGPNFTKVNICPSHTKGNYVIPDKKCILIDDHLNNIKDWSKAGGIAIHHDENNLEKTLNMLLRNIP